MAIITALSSTAIKTFEVEEGTTVSGRYNVTVRFNGKVVDKFTRDTMDDAYRAFRAAGYRMVAWAEDRKIICQDDRE